MTRLRVLIADDESLSRNLLRSSLMHWGCEVTAVNNGEEACMALQAGTYDLCLLDWDMPNMTGLEVCQWVRFADLKSEPYVVLLTRKSDPEHIRSAYRAGANDFLTKPFRLEDLRSRISSLAAKIYRAESLRREWTRLDPLECYRRDLVFHVKAQSQLF